MRLCEEAGEELGHKQEEGPFTKNPSPHGDIPEMSYPNENMVAQQLTIK